MTKKRSSAAALAVAVLMAAASLVGCSSNNYPQIGKDGELAQPQSGQSIATISIGGYGDIKVMLFDDIAPKAVENFLTHAKEGYYDGLKFHRVISDFMIQGGDPTGTGAGGESIWGSAFEDEFSDKLYNFTGALSMANSGANTNGSQFFIVNTPAISADDMKSYNEQIDEYNKQVDEYNKQYDAGLEKKEKINSVVSSQYSAVGGTPWLDGAHTVFGQVYEGLEVVQSIMATETDSDDMPLEDVVIDTITVGVFE